MNLSLYQSLEPEKQKKIVNVSLEEFADKGYSSANMNTIVQKAGISKGAIFKYFGSQKGLFYALFKILLLQIKDYIRSVRDARVHDDFFVRLEKLIQAGVVFTQKHPKLAKIYYRLIYTGDSPFKEEILAELHQESFRFIKSLILTGMENGELNAKIDTDVAAFMIQSALDRFLQLQQLTFLNDFSGPDFKSSEEIDHWIENIIAVFKTGLRGGIA